MVTCTARWLAVHVISIDVSVTQLQAIEDEIGEREMTVRELFRTASRMSDMHPAPRTTAMPHTASLTGVSGEQSASSRRSQRELRRKGSL